MLASEITLFKLTYFCGNCNAQSYPQKIDAKIINYFFI